MAAIYGFYYYRFQGNVKITDKMQKSQQISDWKTYVDSQYKFSIQYPSTYHFRRDQHNYYDRKVGKEIPIKIQEYLWEEGEVKAAGGVTEDAITLEIYPQNLEPFDQNGEDKGDTVIVGGQTVKKRYGLGGAIVIVGPLLHNGYNFIFHYDVPYSLTNAADQSTFNKVISSIKLL